MTKQIHEFSLEEILCPNEIKNKEESIAVHVVSDEVQNLISKIPQRVGIVAFERKIVVQKHILEIKFSKIAR